MQSPVLVAAIQQVEQDGRGDDRHQRRSDGKATPGFAQEGLHPASGIEAEGRTAREHQRIDFLHGLVGGEEIRVTGSRCAAHDVDRGDGRGLGDDDRYTRFQPCILSMPDAEAGNVEN